MADMPPTTAPAPGASPSHAIVHYTPVMRRFDLLLTALAAHVAAERVIERLPDGLPIPPLCLEDSEQTLENLSHCIATMALPPVRLQSDELLLDFARILQDWFGASSPDEHPAMRQDLMRMNGLRASGHGPVIWRINRQLDRGRRQMRRLRECGVYMQTGHLTYHPRTPRPDINSAPPWLA